MSYRKKIRKTFSLKRMRFYPCLGKYFPSVKCFLATKHRKSRKMFSGKSNPCKQTELKELGYHFRRKTLKLEVKEIRKLRYLGLKMKMRSVRKHAYVKNLVKKLR
ncbi:hypothetical protein V6Z11_A02G070700 [Gossypium hirsutum]